MNNARFAIGLVALLMVASAGAIAFADSDQVDAAADWYGDMQYNSEVGFTMTINQDGVDSVFISIEASGTTFSGSVSGGTVTIPGEMSAGSYDLTIDAITNQAPYYLSDTVTGYQLWEISFNMGSSSEVIDPVVVSDGYAYTLPACADPDFSGWQVNGQNYAPGDVIVINGNTTVTAQFGEVELIGIEVVNNQTSYNVGDAPDLTVYALYSNGNRVTVEDYTVSPEAFTEAGTIEVTVSYGGFDDIFSVTVVPSTQTFTVTWVNWDGTVLETDENVAYGEVPEYNGETPMREGDAQYTYSFNGWSPELSLVTDNMIYTATYTQTVNEYTVTWYDDDRTTVLYTAEVPYGETPVYSGQTPTKDSTDQYSYEFAGWNPVMTGVTADAQYYATYTPIVREYTVTWVNEDGSVLATNQVPYGETPVYGGDTPSKESDIHYDYSFAGWTPEIASVTGDIQYTATYTSTLRTYTVTWVVEGQDNIIQEYEYGAMPEYPHGIPVRESDAQYTYSFVGWDSPISEVTGDIMYTAQFYETVNTYTVTWVNWDGTVLETDADVPYGTVPVYDGADPTRPSTSDTTYLFKGFAASGDTPLLDGTIIGDTTMVAIYEANVNFGGYDITLDFGIGGNVSVTPSATDPTIAVVTISPSTGFYVVSVDIDPISEATVVYRGDVNGVMTYEIMDIRSDLTVDVMFMSIDSGDDDPVPNPPVVIVPGDDGNGAIIVAAAAAVLIIVFAAVYIIYGRKS